MMSGFVHRLSCGLLDFPLPMLGKRPVERNHDKRSVINRADLIEVISKERREERTRRKRRGHGRKRHSAESLSQSSRSTNSELAQDIPLSYQRTADSLSPNTVVMFDSNLDFPVMGYAQKR